MACNEDISWYQSLSETQESVEMRNILRYGIYQVGVGSQSKLPQNIHEVIFVRLNPPDDKVLKTIYNFDELRDLGSKLVLITGCKAENKMEVDHYLNVSSLSHVSRLIVIICTFSLDPPTCDYNCRSVTESTKSWKRHLFRLDSVV